MEFCEKYAKATKMSILIHKAHSRICVNVFGVIGKESFYW